MGQWGVIFDVSESKYSRVISMLYNDDLRFRRSAKIKKITKSGKYGAAFTGLQAFDGDRMEGVWLD